jgi:hypothetical protein
MIKKALAFAIENHASKEVKAYLQQSQIDAIHRPTRTTLPVGSFVGRLSSAKSSTAYSLRP